jgi:hypothetical protein
MLPVQLVAVADFCLCPNTHGKDELAAVVCPAQVAALAWLPLAQTA